MKCAPGAVTWAAAVLMAGLATAQPAIPKVSVHFKPGASSATVTRTIKGDETIDYILGAKAGQTMTVTLKSSNRSNYFNVLAPGSEEAIFIGSSEGNNFKGPLPKSGDYSVRVYLMRNAARRNETANLTLTFSITGAGSAEAPAVSASGFDKTLGLQGIAFRVTCPNDSAKPIVTVTPSHLEIDNSPMTAEADGHVTGAEVADLNADGSPEIYVVVRSADTPARVSLVAYAANRKKSLSGIFLPALADDARLAKGYRGGGELAIVERSLVRRFPIYRDGETTPTGGTRQIQYTLAQGEAGWTLKAGKVREF